MKRRNTVEGFQRGVLRSSRLTAHSTPCSLPDRVAVDAQRRSPLVLADRVAVEGSLVARTGWCHGGVDWCREPEQILLVRRPGAPNPIRDIISGFAKSFLALP